MCLYNAVKYVPCKTAAEFIDAISPCGPNFRRFSPEEAWIFRGHGDDTYKLIPSALRSENATCLHRLAMTESIVEPDGSMPAAEFLRLNVAQCLAEAMILGDFFHRADRSGLPLPEDSQKLRTLLRDTIRQLEITAAAIRGGSCPRPTVCWPPDDLLSLLAIAQHHGLLTRLLDWSWSPYTAAYFAGIDVCRRQEQLPLKKGDRSEEGSDLMAVWALNLPERHVRTIVEVCRIHRHLQLISVPRASNANLHAQDGVFTLAVPRDSPGNQPVDTCPVDMVFSDILMEWRDLHVDDSPFYHFTVPKNEARRVLWYLGKNGVDAAKLFPGFEGAARAVLEQQHQMAPACP